MPLPIALNSVFPRLDNTCTACKQGFLLVSNIEGAEPPLAVTTGVTVKPAPSVREPSPAMHGPGGNRIFTAFQNRLAPLVVAVQLIHELADDEGNVNLQQLAEEFKRRCHHLRKHLADRLENPMGVGRGQKLSDGFPSADNETTTKITLRNYLGIVGERAMPGIGLLQECALVEIVDQTKFRLTQNARPFLDLENLHNRLLATDELEEFGSNPILPAYYSDEFAYELSTALSHVSPDHHDWLMHILANICDESSKTGWDSNVYAVQETEKAILGQGHPRWSLTNNQHPTLLDKFRAQAENKYNDDVAKANHARTRHERHVNGKLASALSHLKELGFIVPVAVGNTKNFAVTERGYRYLASTLKEVVA
jgi:hypothetical protein